MKKFNKFKTYISSIICILVSSLVISFVAFTYAAYLNHEEHNHSINVKVDYSEYFGEGSNPKDKVYYITSPEHLRNLSQLVAIGVFGPDYTFVLGNDIVYDSNPLIPIGSDDTPFYSTFDGRGKTISNLRVVGSDLADVGMFGYVANGATIKNFFLDSPIVTARGTMTDYSNDGFLNRSKNLLYQKFQKADIDAIKIVPDITSNDSVVKGTVNGVANSVIGFKKFSFDGLDSFSQYNPQIYISKNVVDSSNSNPSYKSTFTLNTSLTESQYFTVEIYVEGIISNENGENYYSRYTLERFKIYLKVDSEDTSNKYFVFNPNDKNVYRKTIETEPSYVAVGNTATFYYNRHVVYGGIVCGHLDGNAEYIGVINGTLKADNRPIRSNSILIGKRIDDDDVSNLAKEDINFAECITDNIAFIKGEENGIENLDCNKGISNRYVKNIYKDYNSKSTLSSDAEKFFRIYGSNNDGSGVEFKQFNYVPVINDGNGTFIPETDNQNQLIKKYNKTFISINKPLVCLNSDDGTSYAIFGKTYQGSKNYLQENCISMWITKESSQASALSTLLSQTGDFYLNFEFDYILLDSNISSNNLDGNNSTPITLTIKTTSKHNEKAYPTSGILTKFVYYNFKYTKDDNTTIDINGKTFCPAYDVNLSNNSTNGTLQTNSDGSDPRIFNGGVYKSLTEDQYPVVQHKSISIASNSSYFNTDDIAKRTPIFNLGLSVPDTYDVGTYSLNILNFSVTLTSTSGNVVGDPLTVDFLKNSSDNIQYNDTTNEFEKWPNSSMIRVSSTCFSKFLAGVRNTDYSLNNGVFTYQESANYGSYNTLVPGSGSNAFYIVGTRANNSKNNKNNVTITYYNSVSDGTNNNIPYNETGYTAASIVAGQ